MAVGHTQEVSGALPVLSCLRAGQPIRVGQTVPHPVQCCFSPSEKAELPNLVDNLNVEQTASLLLTPTQFKLISKHIHVMKS